MADVTFLTLAQANGAPRSRIQVAKLGRFKDPRYGTFTITPQDVQSWTRLLSDHFNGRVPIDLDHKTDKGVSSEAAAWITSIELDGDKVMSNVEWTPLGESAVREKRYLYISPTFVGGLRDQTDRNLGPALLRAALTNNPFLHDMPAVSLDAGPVFAQADPDPQPGPDTRSVMSPLTKIALALGLNENADEATCLAAVEQAKTPSSPTVTLDAATLVVQAEGNVILSKEDHDKLNADAAKAGALELRVTTLEGDAREQRFALAYDAALSDGRVDAKPETRELHKAIFDKDADLALRNLQALPVVVNLTTRTRDQAPGDAPADVHAESYQLDQKVQAYLAEHADVDYPTALDRVLATQGA